MGVGQYLPPWVRLRWRGARTALNDTGWLASLRTASPVDATGQPIPWMTFPVLRYLEHLDLGGCDVLEWGSGNSTVYWARRSRSVVSIEHSPAWHTSISERMDAERVTCILASEGPGYVEAPQGRDYDLVVIDGVNRDDCAVAAPPLLRPGGMILLDDSDRYPTSCQHLREQGFVQIDFWGLAPLVDYMRCTSLFLKGRSGIPHSGLPGAAY